MPTTNDTTSIVTLRNCQDWMAENLSLNAQKTEVVLFGGRFADRNAIML